MREIKFRAWDDSVKRWIPLYQSMVAPIGSMSMWATERGFTLLQYTGLKDKNGVEIYEGDVVKETIRSFDTKSGVETRTYPITWGTEFAGFNVGVAPHWSVLNPHDVQRMEVIGNIYENPELCATTS